MLLQTAKTSQPALVSATFQQEIEQLNDQIRVCDYIYNLLFV